MITYTRAETYHRKVAHRNRGGIVEIGKLLYWTHTTSDGELIPAGIVKNDDGVLDVVPVQNLRILPENDSE